MRNVINEIDDSSSRRKSLRSDLKKAVTTTEEGGTKHYKKSRDSAKHTGLTHAPLEVSDRPSVNKSKRQHWGYHLLMDISDCNKGIDDEKTIVSFLKELVKALKMKPIGSPIVVKVHNKEGRGTSAIQLITTSNITFHGDDDEWSAYIDVFSCAPYDPKVAIDLVKKYFEPKHMGDLWVHRDAGKWPKK